MDPHTTRSRLGTNAGFRRASFHALNRHRSARAVFARLVLITSCAALPAAADPFLPEVTILTPAGAQLGTAYGVSGDQQAGTAGLGATPVAGIWRGTAASWVSLEPDIPGIEGSEIYGISGNEQVGYVDNDVQVRASLWHGSADSWVDLHAGGPNSNSLALGVGDGQQVGWTLVNGAVHASLWSGTAASWVDLHPGSDGQSIAFGASSGRQVGLVEGRAALWSGTPESWIDLTPVGATGAGAHAIDHNTQVGGATFNGRSHAGLWHGTAASWIDLDPIGSQESGARGVSGDWQIGYAIFNGVMHASLWRGTAASWLDLNTLLPPGLTSARAFGISADDERISIVGDASGLPILWRLPVPEPATIVTVSMILATTQLRRTRTGRSISRPL